MLTKILNYSKLCVISVFAKKVYFSPSKHASRCFSNEFSQHDWQESFDGDSFVSQSMIRRNPSMVIPLLANQDLMPMLVQ